MFGDGVSKDMELGNRVKQSQGQLQWNRRDNCNGIDGAGNTAAKFDNRINHDVYFIMFFHWNYFDTGCFERFEVF